jgi:branched-subunit amino acid ABC-type transport system permease component
MMPKRVFWFAAGAVSGFGGALYGYARVREVRGRFAADRLADTVSGAVVGSARSVRVTVREAVAEGRDAMRDAETEIRAHVERPPTSGIRSSGLRSSGLG